MAKQETAKAKKVLKQSISLPDFGILEVGTEVTPDMEKAYNDFQKENFDKSASANKGLSLPTFDDLVK